MEIVNLILHYTNLKINAFLDTLDWERKPYYARTIEVTELLAFFFFFFFGGGGGVMLEAYFIIT